MLRTPGVVSLSAITCQKRPLMGGGQRAIIPRFDAEWHTAPGSKGLPARVVLMRLPLRLDSAGAGGAGGAKVLAKGEWDVVAGKWRSGNDRSGRAWLALRALAACARSFLSLVVQPAPPLSPSSHLHQGEMETNMSRAPSIHACAMVPGPARNRPLQEWMQELIGCEELMWQNVMSCALAFNHVRPERVLPLVHVASGVAGASSINWRHAARRAAGVQREGEGGGKERLGWTVVSSSCQGQVRQPKMIMMMPFMPQQAPGVDPLPALHAENAQRSSEELVVVEPKFSMKRRSRSSVAARGIFSLSKLDLHSFSVCQHMICIHESHLVSGDDVHGDGLRSCCQPANISRAFTSLASLLMLVLRHVQV